MMGWRLLILGWLVEETAGFGSLQYLNSNAPVFGSKLTVAPVPGVDDASLFHQGTPSVAGSARVGATPYWSLDDSAMTNTGMSDVFQKRPAPTDCPLMCHNTLPCACHTPTPPSTSYTNPIPPPHHPLPTLTPVHRPLPLATVQLHWCRRLAPSHPHLATAAPLVAAYPRMRFRHLPVRRVHGLSRLRVLRWVAGLNPPMPYTVPLARTDSPYWPRRLL